MAADNSEQRIISVFDISKVLSHNNAVVTRSAPVTVTTDFAQWSYAAAFPLDVQQLGSESPVLIRIEATIEEGRIGAIVVADDLKSIVGTPVERSSIDRDTTMDLMLNQSPSCGWLILRNNAPEGARSRCIIHSITSRRVPEETAPERRASLGDVSTPQGDKIDIVKLGKLAAQATGPDGFGANTIRDSAQEVE